MQIVFVKNIFTQTENLWMIILVAMVILGRIKVYIAHGNCYWYIVMCPIKSAAYFSRIFFPRKIKKILNNYLFVLSLVPLLFIVYPLIHDGILITGDFPYFDTPDYAVDRLWLWIEKGSIDGFEFVSRFPIIGFNYLLGTIGVSSAVASKAMVVAVFAITSISFYFSFVILFKDRFGNFSTALRLSSILGSLFYAYNIWSFNRIHHWYLWLGYSLLPLFLISILYSFKNPKSWKPLVSSTFLWTIASSTPHMTVFYGIILASTFLLFITNSLIKKNKTTFRTIIPLLLIISSYLLVNMYWIYPYAQASQSGVLTPNYELTEENLELLSREGSFVNSFRVMAYWLNTDIQTQGASLYYFSLIFSFVIPIIAFCAIFFQSSKKYSLLFTVCALTGILLAMGTQSPLHYYEYMLSIPVLSHFTWLFRDSDKWSFLISLAYAFLLGIVSYNVYTFFPKGKKRFQKKLLISTGFSALLITSVVATSLPYYNARMDPLKPVTLPSEFEKLNKYMLSLKTDKVYFIPSADETIWKINGRVGSIYEVQSNKPSIEATEYNFQAKNYYDFLVSSISENRTQDISNLIYPLGTQYLIFHNDTWNKKSRSPDVHDIALLNNLYSLNIKNESDIGFYKIFKVGNDNNDYNVKQVNIPLHTIATDGGLDMLNSLNSIPSYDALNDSLFFLNDQDTINPNMLPNFDTLLLNQRSSYDGLAARFASDTLTVAPFDYTIKNSPSHVWSKSTARDLTHAEFHPYMQQLKIRNWDLDLGKGLVVTKAFGANISLPFGIPDNKNDSTADKAYNLYARVLQGEKGGIIKIYIDNKLIKEIDTYDGISNDFVWEKVSTLELEKGSHILTLENVAGFNAVNAFNFVSSSQMKKINAALDNALQGSIRVAHLFEAETSFKDSKGKDIATEVLRANLAKNTDLSIGNDSFSERWSGQLKVPANSNLMSVAFLSPKNQSGAANVSYALKVEPAYLKQSVFSLNFERKDISTPLATIRQLDWFNYDKDLVTTSLETMTPIDGNTSLRADIKQGDKYGQNILSTDYIPIVDSGYYNASLDISARDVKQLYSRIVYFDSEKRQTSTDLVFERKDGTFKDSFASSIIPPKGTKFVKYQVLTMSDNQEPSMYLLDNVKFDEIVPPSTKEFNMDTTGTNLTSDTLVVGTNKNDTGDINLVNGSLSSHHGPANNTTFSKIETKPFAVRGDRIYNYSIISNRPDLTSPIGIATFKKSSELLKNSSKYGNEASNGNILSLKAGDDIYTQLDIIKKSNYTFAVRASACQSCSVLKLSIQHIDKNCSLCKDQLQTDSINISGNTSELNWIISNNTFQLDKGIYDLKIHSDSNVDLDSILFLQNDLDHVQITPSKDTSGGINDLFTVDSGKAILTGFKKIDPTKYVLTIENATKPYTVSLAEAFDPLWTAYPKNSTDDRVNSHPLYGVVNGFNVNKTGSYTLVVEYQPQRWFVQGGLVSILSIVGLILTLVITTLFWRTRRPSVSRH